MNEFEQLDGRSRFREGRSPSVLKELKFIEISTLDQNHSNQPSQPKSFPSESGAPTFLFPEPTFPPPA